MGYTDELKKLLLRILGDGQSGRDVNRLCEITVVIAKSYLQTHYSSFMQICLQKGERAGDLSRYSIAEIFERDEKGVFVQLQNFAESLDAPIKEAPKEEVIQAYYAFVKKVALRQLVKTYSDADSTGAKIYRNIQDFRRNSNTIVITKDLWGAVLRPSGDSLSDHLPPFPKDELARKFAIKMGNSTTIPDMISVLIEVLKGQETWRRSLPVFDVVQLFKRYHSQISTYEPTEVSKPDLSELSKSDFEILKNYILKTIWEKIFSTYVAKRKIDITEANLLYLTLVDIIDALFDEEKELSSYSQYAKMNLHISEAEYKEHWRTKVEYMVRIARNKIAVYVVEGLKIT